MSLLRVFQLVSVASAFVVLLCDLSDAHFSLFFGLWSPFFGPVELRSPFFVSPEGR